MSHKGCVYKKHIANATQKKKTKKQKKTKNGEVHLNKIRKTIGEETIEVS